MLLSIILNLTATDRYPILGTLSRPVHAWMLNQIMRRAPHLAKTLHDENGNKPFTASTLLDRHGHPLRAGDWLAEGQECWLRMTTIGQELSDTFLVTVLKNLPPKVNIYKMDFRIDGYTINPHNHPWAGQTTFADIAQDSQYSKVSREVRMEFVSPTAFRSNGNDIALPIPKHVFRSLWKKWNAVCPRPMLLDDIWPEFAEDCILVKELTSVNSVHWEFADGTRGGATGYTGTVGFSLLSKTKVLEKWQPYWDGSDAVMQSLARFAYYSGVGHHSTVGMGQTRVVPISTSNSVSRKNFPNRNM